MQQLLFLYLEDYLDFGNIAINFTNSYDISYRNGQLNIKNKEDLIGHMYGDNIIDMNIIAGQNGIGKTTLLKIIADVLRDKDRYSESYDYNYIKILKDSSGQVTLYCTSRMEPHIILPGDADIDIEIDKTYEPGYPIVYYSPFMDFNMLEIYSDEPKTPIFDLSQTKIMMEDMEEKDRDEEQNFIEPYSLLSHKLSNIKRHLVLLKSNSHQFKLPFHSPTTFWVNFHRLHADKEDISIEHNYIFKEFQAKCATFFREFPSNGISRANMAHLMFLRNLLGFFFRSVNNVKTRSILQHSFKNFESGKIDLLNDSNPQELILLIVEFFEKQDVFPTEIFQDLIEVAFQATNDENVTFRNANNLLTLELDLSSPIIDKIFSILSEAQKSNHNRELLPPLNAFISFDWNNFSSGEKMFLDLFSRLYSIKEKLSKIKEPIIMMIDEGEMGFHPSWQLDYIRNLKIFFNRLLPKNHFQLILATHSPLVLSDFPKERVHLLKKNSGSHLTDKLNSPGTFAQSTSELLANEFFIETSLVGSLAKEFIDELLSEISKITVENVSQKKRKSLLKKIMLIDEPLIKNLLKNELERKLNA